MRLTIVLTLFSAMFSTSVLSNPITGRELDCGGSHYYFGNKRVFYAENFPSGQSILGNDFDRTRYSFHVPYDNKWHLVRTFDCRSNAIICEREYMRARNTSNTRHVEFRTDLTVLRTPDSDPGLAAIFFYTIRDQKIRISKGYTATAQQSYTFHNGGLDREYRYSDNIGNKFLNNLWKNFRSSELKGSKCTDVN